MSFNPLKRIILFALVGVIQMLAFAQQPQLVPLESNITHKYVNHYNDQLNHTVFEIGKVDSTYTPYKTSTNFTGSILGMLDEPNQHDLNTMPFESKPEKLTIKFSESTLSSFRFTDDAKYTIKYLDVLSGLPNNSIYTICETTSGDIWFAFPGGVAKISGNLLYKADARTGFPDYKITSIKEFNGSIYLATFGGGLIEFKGNQFFKHDKNTMLKSNHLLDLCIYQNKLYCSTYETGIFSLNSDNTGEYFISTPFDKISPVIESMTVYENKLYFTYKSGFGYVEQNKLYTWTEVEGLPNDNYGIIRFDNEGKIYITAADNCLITIDHFNTIKSFQNFKLKWNRVNSIQVGKSGYVWIATELDGLYSVTGKKAIKFDSNDGLTSNSISSLYQDSYDNLWIGTRENGLNIFIPSKFTLNYQGGGDIKGNCRYGNNILAIENGQHLIMLTDTGYYKFTHPEFNSLTDLAYDSINKNLWIASNFGLFKLHENNLQRYVLTAGTYKVSNHLVIKYTNDNELFIGDYNFGLLRLKNDAFTFYPDWSQNNNQWIENIIVNRDKNQLWVSSHLGNLSFIDKDSIFSYNVAFKGVQVRFYSGVSIKNQSFFITNLGLVYEINKQFFLLQYNLIEETDNFRSIAAIKNKTALCLTSYSKMFIIEPNSIERYVVNGEIVPVSFSKDALVENPRNKTVYIGTNSGMLSHYFFNYKNENKPRKIEIQKIEVLDDNRKYINYLDIASIKADSLVNNYPSGLSIPYQYNTVRLKFNYTNWGTENNSTYYYKIDGNKWTPFNDELELTNLKTGEHQLDIKAEANGLTRIEPLIFNFTITPPFYMTWWFVLGLLLVITGFVWYFIRNISTINFDTFKANTESSFLIKKAQLLMIISLILLIGVDYFHGEINRTYIVNWSLNITLSVVAVGLYIIIRIGKYSPVIISNLILTAFSVFILHLFIRAGVNAFNPIVSLESAITLLFAIFVITDSRNLIVYCLFVFAGALTLTFIFEGNSEHKTLFLSALVQIVICLILFSFLERTNLSRILFAHKLLQYSRQFVIVANKEAEIIYVNDYMLNTLGIKQDQVIGKAWWNYRNWNSNKIEEVKLHFQKLITENSVSTYTNTLTNINLNQNITIEWQDTPIEGDLVLGIGSDITEKVQRNLELERLSLVATNVTNGVIIADADSHIEWANKSFLELMNYSFEEVKGQIPIELFSGPNTDRGLRELVRYNEPEQGFEIVLYSKKKKAIWFFVTVTKILNEQNKINKKVFVLTDISQEVNRRNRTDIILNNSGDLIYTCDIDGNFTYANNTLNTLFGFNTDEFIGKHYSSVIHKEDIESAIQFYSNLVKRKQDNSQMELRVYHKNGDVIWVRQTVNFIYSNDGLVEGFIAVAKDITASKIEAIEKELYSLKELNYSRLLTTISQYEFNNLNDFIVHIQQLIKHELELPIVNIWLNSTRSISQFEKSNSPQEDISLLKDDFKELFEQINQGQLIAISDIKEVHFDQSILSGYLLPNNIQSILACGIYSEGQVWGIITFETNKEIRDWDEIESKFIRNLSEIFAANIQLDLRRKAENKIQESEANFRLLNETIDDVFWLMDLKTKQVIYISPSSTKILGIEPYLFYNTDEFWKNYVVEEDKPTILRAHELIEKNGYYELEYRIVKNGQIRWIAEKSFGIKNAEGEFVKSSGICRDITEKKEKESIIEQQNFDILSSINYAQRIQFALLPDTNLLNFKSLKASIFFKPKDIIGGDFYWFDVVDDVAVFAVGDCTGHGVPGALMTSIGINGLINAVSEQKKTNPADILTYLDEYVFTIFNKESEDNKVKDGMDIIVLTYHLKTKEINFASAGRPLLKIGNETRLIKGNRKSIGSNILDETYQNHSIEYENNLTVYLFSDGLIDQFGGPDKRRITSKKFYEICNDIHQFDVKKQKSTLEKIYSDWQGDLKQTDDMICMILKFK